MYRETFYGRQMVQHQMQWSQIKTLKGPSKSSELIQKKETGGILRTI